MKQYINYQNSLNVLNEGFFSWVWKLSKAIFKKILSAKNFDDLNDNISKLEKIIKYGAKLDGNPAISESLKINEGRSRSRNRINEDGENTQENEPLKLEPSKLIPKDQINMNIPSYRQTCILMLEGLEDELKNAKSKVTANVIENWNNALSAGKYLYSSDAQYIQLLVTDFIRKYSGGQIAPPTLNGKDLLSTGELEVWNKLLKKTESGNNNETHFKSVYDALKKVLDNYNTNFKETLEELIKNSNSEEINNFKMIQENKLKIQSKWDAIHQRCENYISSAIATYFVNDEVYKSSLDFIKELLVILTKNSEIVNRSSKSEIGRLINLDDEDKVELIENVAEKYNLLRSNIEKFNNGKQENTQIDLKEYPEIFNEEFNGYINDILEGISKIYKNNKNIKPQDILNNLITNTDKTKTAYPILFYLMIKTLDKNNMINYYINDNSNNKHNVGEFLK